MVPGTAIQPESIQAGVAERLRGFVAVDGLPLPPSFRPLVDAFWEATRLIAPSLVAPRWVITVFATAPFTINIPTGQFVFTPNPAVVAAYINDTIFYDCNKIAGYKYPFQVVCFLEELVHVLMNIADEELTKRVVTHLYPTLEYADGEYRLRAAE